MKLKHRLFRDRSMTSVADELGVDISTVSQWLRRGNIPAERVLALEAATGVSRHILRPDIYPRKERVQRATGSVAGT